MLDAAFTALDGFWPLWRFIAIPACIVLGVAALTHAWRLERGGRRHH